MTTATETMATTDQKYTIRKNSNFNVDIKEEWVQWATGDVAKTSLNDLTYAQAEQIILQQTGQTQPQLSQQNWGAFDVKNSKHLAILSLCRQAQKTTFIKGREVADLAWLSHWLQTKAPVKKALLKQDAAELSKTIKAMEGVVRSIFG